MRCLPVLIICFLLGSCSVNDRPRIPQKIDGGAPYAYSLDGQKVTLAAYRGKIVLVNFWASWCVPCKRELGDFGDLQNRFKDRLAIIAVALDQDESDVKAYADKEAPPFSVLVDRDGSFREFFDVFGLPQTLILSRNGTILPIIDPDNGRTESKIIGSRDWQSPEARKSIATLLEETKNAESI